MVWLIPIGLVLIAIVLYIFSVMSRKSYRCPKCGEKVVDVEYLSANRCGMCGAPLERQ